MPLPQASICPGGIRETHRLDRRCRTVIRCFLRERPIDASLAIVAWCALEQLAIVQLDACETLQKRRRERADILERHEPGDPANSLIVGGHRLVC